MGDQIIILNRAEAGYLSRTTLSKVLTLNGKQLKFFMKKLVSELFQVFHFLREITGANQVGL